MPVVQRCCFCISLPNGGITLGSLGIISGILSIVSTVFGLVNLDKTFRVASENLKLDITHDEYENVKTFYKISVIAYLVITIVITVSAVLLIIGTNTKKRGLMLPWLVGNMISIVCSGVFVLAMITSQQTAPYIILVTSIILVIQIYLWICIYSLFQLLGEQQPQQVVFQTNEKSGRRLYPVAVA